MNENIKWLFTIARKNDIPKETIYTYIDKKYGKTSVRELTKEEMEDTLVYVSDARLVAYEKQIVRIIATAKIIPLDKTSLDHMCSRFGGRCLEDLDENGLRGMLAIISGMAERKHGNSNNYNEQI